MRGLKIVVLTADAERFRGALTLAAAHAAIGGSAVVLLQLGAVALLGPATFVQDDPACAAIGLPTLAELLEEALDLGVEIVACQSGLMLAGLRAAELDARIAVGGPVGFLQTLDPEERLIIV